MSAEPADWALAESWLTEHDTARRIAQNHRAESAMFLERINELKTEHPAASRPVEIQRRIHDLELSRWHAIEHAAVIERRLRGIG